VLNSFGETCLSIVFCEEPADGDTSLAESLCNLDKRLVVVTILAVLFFLSSLFLVSRLRAARYADIDMDIEIPTPPAKRSRKVASKLVAAPQPFSHPATVTLSPSLAAPVSSLAANSVDRSGPLSRSDSTPAASAKARCKVLQSTYQIVPLFSWGSTTETERVEYRQLSCDHHLTG